MPEDFYPAVKRFLLCSRSPAGLSPLWMTPWSDDRIHVSASSEKVIRVLEVVAVDRYVVYCAENGRLLEFEGQDFPVLLLAADSAALRQAERSSSGLIKNKPS